MLKLWVEIRAFYPPKIWPKKI